MISIFTTGGTFDKIYYDALSEFSIGDPQAIPLLQEANINPAYQVQSVLRKDSLDINDDDRAMLRDQVAACESRQIIITHGTDTMVQSATVVAELQPLDKTVVFVGAMQPAVLRQSDAPFNLGFALAAVQLLAAGVFITINGQVFPYDQVTKNRAAQRFTPHHSPIEDQLK